MIIKSILLLILFFCCVSLFTIYKNKKKDFFFKFFKYLLLFTFVHALHTLICEYFFSDSSYTYRAVPYNLVYGPLFYFLISGLKNSSVKLKVWAIHLIPFFVFSICYLVFLFDDGLRIQYVYLFIKIIYSLTSISFVTYIVVSIFQKQKFVNEIAYIEVKEFVYSMGMILMFIAIFFYVVQYSGGNEKPAVRVIVYSTVLVFVIYIFTFLLRQNSSVVPIETISNSGSSINEDKYTKVKITEEQLDEYEEKLYSFIDESKIFLDIDLSLSKLSKELKIPKYHLSQLFSLRIGKNFNQFINSYRVNFACTILAKNKELKIEELMYQCGFNSKSSFNRHFKMIVGVTPSEYCSELKE